MPKLSPVILTLRDVTEDALHRLMQSGKYKHEKHALEYLYTQARQKRKATGFSMNTFEQFYRQFQDHKRKT